MMCLLMKQNAVVLFPTAYSHIQRSLQLQMPNLLLLGQTRDRFLPTLTTTEPFFPLDSTSPRSFRFARALDLVQPRLLSFHDDTSTSLFNHQLSDPTLPIRAYFAQSLAVGAWTSRPTHSAARYGGAKPDRVLDSGPLDDFPYHPCAWSSRDMIAAVIRGRVFTYVMDTNIVSSQQDHGIAECVEWMSDRLLGIGHASGAMSLIDTGTRQLQRHFSYMLAYNKIGRVNALSYSKELGLFAVGRANGTVTYYDSRREVPVRNDSNEVTHAVVGVKWSPDGLFLAGGHNSGIVRCMDWRAHKTFEFKSPQRKVAHKGAVKSLTWAPWNPRLLATGGNASDHTVRIWSLSSSDTVNPQPLPHTLSFSSGISSLHFSPHATELLSTHGRPVIHPPTSHSVTTSPPHHRRSTPRRNTRTYQPITNPTRHALLVHAYPSLRRVHTVLDAHAEPIIDSVLAPDGTRVLTFGEDETLRVWTVWGERKRERVFNMQERYGLR
ncbi:WD40 repeat-like protein [Ramaria rubella]|nr:WD40 repeat-like protein [Ramaria rubella]